MQKLFVIHLLLLLMFKQSLVAQNVGIGTTTPHAKAALEIKSTDKGILFPRLNNTQRNLITDPPHGLHIFNTDENCLNYYDSTNRTWNCYCNDCSTVIINITSNQCKVDFYNSYAKNNVSKRYLINITAGVIISGCNPGDTALDFRNMPFNATISINNYGTIQGAGGEGGNATVNKGCYGFPSSALSGQNGGSAIATIEGVKINLNNYGIVAGGGGGGGGGGGLTSTTGYGGGGGGGAGMPVGNFGKGGGIFVTSPPFNVCSGAISYQGQNGTSGQPTTGGIGGLGVGGGFAGGNGGARAQAGQIGGGGYLATASNGGLAGKAIGGGSGNSIVNNSGGQSFGLVD